MICKHCGRPIRWVEGKGWAKPNDNYAQMGICASRTKGHQLRDDDDYATDAQNNWKALRSLDPFRAERAELEAAKVPKHTIDALLGEGFEILVPGLIQLLGEGSLNFVVKHKRFADASAYIAELSESQRGKFRADLEKWSGSQAEEQLVNHIESILPHGTKANFARQCSTYLWEACWYMAHAEQLMHYPKRTQWLVEFIEKILPDLIPRVNALHRAARKKQSVKA